MRLKDAFVDYERFVRDPECHGGDKCAVVRGGDAPVERQQLLDLSDAGVADVDGEMTILTDVTFVTDRGFHGLVGGARRIFHNWVQAVFSREKDVKVVVLDGKLQAVRFEARLKEIVDEVMRDLEEDFPQTRSLQSFDRNFHMDYYFYNTLFVKSNAKVSGPELVRSSSLEAQNESIKLRNSFEACLMRDLVQKGPEALLRKKFTDAGFPDVKITWSSKDLDYDRPERLSVGVVIEKAEKIEGEGEEQQA